MSAPKVGAYLVGMPLQSTGTLAIAAENIYASPFWVARNMSVDRLALQITVAAAAGKFMRLGLYTSTSALLPSTLIVGSDAIAADATGVKTATIDVDLTRGWYHVAVLSDGTPTIRGAANAIGWTPLGIRATDTAQFEGCSYGAQAYGAMPATFPASSLESWYFPILLRVASLN